MLCLDNYFTGRRGWRRAPDPNPLFRAMRHDITLPLFIEVDGIFNFACPASPIHYQHDPWPPPRSASTARSTCSASPSMAQNVDPASLHQRGSMATPTYWPEILGPRQPDRAARACYDEAALRRNPVLRHHRQRALDQVMRIFNTYGPRMQPNDGRVVWTSSCGALKEGESITIYGDGQQTRSFCYVDDLVEERCD